MHSTGLRLVFIKWKDYSKHSLFAYFINKINQFRSKFYLMAHHHFFQNPPSNLFLITNFFSFVNKYDRISAYNDKKLHQLN